MDRHEILVSALQKTVDYVARKNGLGKMKRVTLPTGYNVYGTPLEWIVDNSQYVYMTYSDSSVIFRCNRRHNGKEMVKTQINAESGAVTTLVSKDYNLLRKIDEEIESENRRRKKNDRRTET